ncbi:MAG TPA: hypothetical protein VD886_04225, partial [Herpetosiphonaceae bacterium]|nr:hypothetical protein [Herpetosiphonaceae bacterium]
MESPRLYVFGAPRLEPGGAPITLPTPLAALAAYLAVHGRVARWRLAGAIWPDLSEAQARRMLSTALYRLRRSLGEAAH